MDDILLNCVLEVCCEGGSAAQLNALATIMSGELVCSIDEAKPYATFILGYFDLAEKGSLTAFKASIARLARGPQHPQPKG